MYKDQTDGLFPGWMMTGPADEFVKCLSQLTIKEKMGSFGDQAEASIHG